jgi:PPM family protein phosphatase
MIHEDPDGVVDTVEYVTVDNKVSRFYESEPRTRVKLEVAGKTHPGLVRPNNEDQYLVVRRYRGREIMTTSLPTELLEAREDHAYVLAVADGMGGQKFGELASLLAMRTGFELGGDEIKWSVRMNAHEVEELRQKAAVFCRLVDESLRAEIRDNPRLEGMGTTLTICYTTGPNLFTIHVGDSRAYLYRQGVLRQITKDHNLGQILVDSGQAEPESPEVLRVRHVLTNCLGGPHGGVSADVDHLVLANGDRVLLCTDGLNDMVPADEIASILGRNTLPKQACEALIQAALNHGGGDNVTVVVGRYEFEDED